MYVSIFDETLMQYISISITLVGDQVGQEVLF